MQLSIIIPTKDRGKIFERTIAAANDSVLHIDSEIIVVNDSKTSTPQVSETLKKVRLFNNPGQGVASARNFGVRNSTGNLLLFLDDDIVISRASVDQVISLHQIYPNACFNLNWIYPPEMELDKTSFGRFIRANSMNNFKGWYNDPTWQDNALFRSKSVASFHLSIARANFDKTNGYNESFPFAGFEDHDFPLRLKSQGIEFFIDSRVTVYHNESDRLTVKGWLNNQGRRAITRRVAVDLGYQELRLEYHGLKRKVLQLLSPLDFLIEGLLNIIPNVGIFDGIYRKLLSALVAVKIFNGYTSQQNNGTVTKG
jgi:hypothetical protein